MVQPAFPDDDFIKRKLRDLKTEFMVLAANRNNMKSIVRIQDHLSILHKGSLVSENEFMDCYIQTMSRKINTLSDKSLDSYSYMNQLHGLMDLRDYLEAIMIIPFRKRSKYSYLIKKCIGKMAAESVGSPLSFINGKGLADYAKN